MLSIVQSLCRSEVFENCGQSVAVLDVMEKFVFLTQLQVLS